MIVTDAGQTMKNNKYRNINKNKTDNFRLLHKSQVSESMNQLDDIVRPTVSSIQLY